MNRRRLRFNFTGSAAAIAALALAQAWTPLLSAQVTANDVPTQSAETLRQSPDQNVSDAIRELREQVRELQEAVSDLRADNQQSRSENQALRHELAAIHEEIKSASPTQRHGLSLVEAAEAIARPVVSSGRSPDAQIAASENQASEQNQNNDQKGSQRSATLEEEYQLLSGKVDDQYQTKVESASKYRVRLSGIVLMNLVSNYGTTDSIDLPTVAYPSSPGSSGGSFGATLRQSEIGLEAFGPMVAGAKTKADLQLDLAGGFPSVPNGATSGLMRLRTATMRLDWTNTSVVVGQDQIFFSPSSPTSFASLAVPALSAAGNLWGWLPQVRIEHRINFGDESNLLLQAGLLDPLTGEAPATPSGSTSAAAGYYRFAGPGEASRQPAYAARVAWTRNVFGEPLHIGVGSFYSRQDYGFGRMVDGWGAMSDLELPLRHGFSLSGKLYRGKALGGLYGGIGRSVLFSGDPALATTQVQPLNTVGGWAQLKYRPANKWEFNAAFGMDNPFASDLKYFPYAQAYGDPELAKNQGSFANMIYRPRSDLLFSAEYRHLTTSTINQGPTSAGQLNLSMGVLF